MSANHAKLTTLRSRAIASEGLSTEVRDIETTLVLRITGRSEPMRAIGAALVANDAELGELTLLHSGNGQTLHRLMLRTRDDAHTARVIDALGALPGVHVQSTSDVVFECHRGGKIEQASRIALRTTDDLQRVYTPGVARVARAIKSNPARALELTGIGNTVGIFTNGTRVLSLGDIGPLASMPVMEGKAVLYRELVGISAVPILVDVTDPDAFVETVIRIAPGFAGIHLEDIQSPECFEIERQLSSRLRRPVLHDDQDGTATVALAAALRACELAGTTLGNATIGQVGLGAAGSAIVSLFSTYGVGRMLATDTSFSALARVERFGAEAVSLDDLLRKADVVIATTGKAGLIASERVRRGQVILALSNPAPEIEPAIALRAGAAFAADGRTINNALAFPGLLRGALMAQSHEIAPQMLMAAAAAIAASAAPESLVPDVLDPRVHAAVATAVADVATRLGLQGTLVVDDAASRAVLT